MKGVIAFLDNVQRGARSQLFADGTQQREVGERIACPLEEKHRHIYLCQVLRAAGSWAIRRVQRKTEEYQPLHRFKQPLRGSLRRHSSTHGFSSGQQQQLDRKSTRLNSSHQIISYAVFCLKKK